MFCRSLLVLLSFVHVFGVGSSEAQRNDSQRPPMQANEILLPKGTTVKLRVVRPISSATARLGEHVDLAVVEDVKIDGSVIIPKRAKAEGFIAEAVSAKLWGAASVTVYVSSVLTRTGFSVPVHGSSRASAISGAATEEGSREVTIPQDVEIQASTAIDIPLEAAFYRETQLAAGK